MDYRIAAIVVAVIIVAVVLWKRKTLQWETPDKRTRIYRGGEQDLDEWGGSYLDNKNDIVKIYKEIERNRCEIEEEDCINSGRKSRVECGDDWHKCSADAPRKEEELLGLFPGGKPESWSDCQKKCVRQGGKCVIVNDFLCSPPRANTDEERLRCRREWMAAMAPCVPSFSFCVKKCA